MTIESLADLLKSRDVEVVCYFHTDHFEPWSFSIDEASARAVERMAAMARHSPYARRLSLFYSVFIPYHLDLSGEVAGERAPGDGIAFGRRSERQERLAREAIRPLVRADGHEMHLHLHHEFWTRNDSAFNSEVSRWVNAHSTCDADAQRLDLYLGLCNEVIGREIGGPFERWAFIHGNWALNASDPLICQIENEIALLMRHGGFGDFSFPAGRGYCDPKLEAPFTCLPLAAPRAYDDPDADPRPVATGGEAWGPDRFFIWNSPIKANYSSLDYYSEANRGLFETPERMVAAWLGKSVCLDGNLLVKTHAHSMKWEYKIAEPGSVIPHCYPDVVQVFDCLARVCDHAQVELRFVTVNDIMNLLRGADGSQPALAQQPAAASRSAAMTRAASAASHTVAGGAHVQRTMSHPARAVRGSAEYTEAPLVNIEILQNQLADMHRDWIAGEGSRFAPDELYLAKLSRSAPLEIYEIAIAAAMAERFSPAATRIAEIGSGWGGFAILLARDGFDVLGFEGNNGRHRGCRWHFERELLRHPRLRGHLILADEGLFPEIFTPDLLTPGKTNLCVATNITSTYSAENQDAMLRAAGAFDELIVDLARFGEPRDNQPERDALFAKILQCGFEAVERLFFNEPYEYWRFRTRPVSSERAGANIR